MVEALPSARQTIEVEVWCSGPSGYGGITTWYKDPANWTAVFIYPAARAVWVIEVVDNVAAVPFTAYPFAAREANWHLLRVNANGAAGKLTISVDGVFVGEHFVAGKHRSGLSGLYSGNAGGYFDNFKMRAVPSRE